MSQDLLADRDAKIRELEETIKTLQEKLSACDNSDKSIIHESEDVPEMNCQENRDPEL